MDIYALKAHFEAELYRGPARRLAAAEPAWACFRAAARLRPDGAAGEAISFSLGLAAQRQGRAVTVDATRFQVYFGRLIDSDGRQPWRVADVTFYFRFPLTQALAGWLAAGGGRDLEAAFGAADGEAAIAAKLAPVWAGAEAAEPVWPLLRGLVPTTASFEFLLQ